MNPLNLTGYEGPRTPLPDEWDAAVGLRRSVFFPDGPDFPELFRRRPLAWQDECREHTFVMYHASQPVSMITRLERDFVAHGCLLRMGYIGGVCTHHDHRGRGLAGTVLAACMDRFHQHNVDFVHISGLRSLYLRAGAAQVGGCKQFELLPDGLAPFEDSSVNVSEATVNDARFMAECNLREPVHFVRPLADFALSVEHGHCTGAACRFYIVSRANRPVSYVITTEPAGSEGRVSARVFECAGEPLPVLAALHSLVAGMGNAASLSVEFAPTNTLTRLLAAAGIEGTDCPLPRGTMKALDFAQTMAKLRPHFAARLPATTIETLRWTQGAGRYVGWAGRDVLTIDGESNMLWTLLGSPPDGTRSDVHATGAMADLMDECLPIPMPSIYLNNI